MIVSNDGNLQPPRSTPSYRLLFLCIVLISGIIYAPALTGSPIWDDNGLLFKTNGPTANNLRECITVPLIGTTYFRPIVAISFLWDRSLFNGVAIHSHLVNIVLHMISVGCLICFLRQIFARNSIALVGGFFFGVQPAQLKTVAWIGGRTDSLCALWFILFAWSLFASATANGRKRTFLQIASLIAYALAVFTREQAALSILLVPLAHRWFSAEKRASWQQVGPYAVVAALYVACWFRFQTPESASIRSFPEACIYSGWTLAYYFLLLFLPTPKWLNTFTLDAVSSFGVWGGLLGFAFAGSLAWMVVSSRRNPALAWFASGAFLLLMPALNIVKAPVFLVTPYRADASGVCAAAILACCLLNTTTRALVHGFLVAIFGAYYVALTWWGAHQWSDELRFYANVNACDPRFYLTRRNYALVLGAQHRNREAAAAFEGIFNDLFNSTEWQSENGLQRALKANPRIDEEIQRNKSSLISTKLWLANLYADMGQAMRESGQQFKANNAATIALSLDRGNCLGNLEMAAKAKDEQNWRAAIRYLRIGAAAQPDLPACHLQLGEVFMRTENWTSAASEYRKVTVLSPKLAAAHIGLAEALTRLGDLESARRSLLAALGCPFSDTAAIETRLAELDKHMLKN